LEIKQGILQIVFVSPTPNNNQVITDAFVYVNITGNEELNSAQLEWQGVNESMTCSSNNCYINKTGLTKGDYTYRVWAEDLSNNGNWTETMVVKICKPPRRYVVTLGNENINEGLSVSGDYNSTNNNDGVYRIVNETSTQVIQTFFYDDFESNSLINWTETGGGDWRTSSANPANGTYSAIADNSDPPQGSQMYTTQYVDLTTKNCDNVLLSYYWWIDRGLDSGEYLALDLYDGSWHYDVLRLNGNVDAENTWHGVDYNVSENLNTNTNSFRIQYDTLENLANEDVYVDTISLISDCQSIPLNITYLINDIDTTYDYYNLSVKASSSNENFTVDADGVTIDYVDSSVDELVIYNATSIAKDGQVLITFYDTDKFNDTSIDSLNIDFLEVYAWDVE